METPPPAMLQEARAGGRGHIWYLELIIFLAVFTIASAVEAVPLVAAMLAWFASEPKLIYAAARSLTGFDLPGALRAAAKLLGQMPAWMDLAALFATACVTVTVILFCRLIEKRSPATLGLRRSHAVREYLTGIAAALVMISAAVGLGLVSGGYTLSAAPAVKPGLIALYMLGFMIQGMSEEVLCRGYFMVSLARKNPAWLAVLVSSLAFAALHLANPGMTPLSLVNLALSGAVFAVYVLRRGNLWGACALHSFWNFFQGHLYGVPVSGMARQAGASLLQMQPAEGAALWSGGLFGIEGALCDTVVELAALVILLLLPARRDEVITPSSPGTPPPSGS